MDPIYESYKEIITENKVTLKGTLTAVNRKVPNDFDFERGDVIAIQGIDIKKDVIYFKSDDNTKNNSWEASYSDFKKVS